MWVVNKSNNQNTNKMKDEKPTTQSLIRKPIKDGDFLPFVATTKKGGLAEFAICPQWKRGKLVKISIYPIQQDDMSYYYEWEGVGRDYFTIQSYQNLGEPRIWMHYYCKEHKCQSMFVYVPSGSNFIWFQVYGNNISIGFTKESW